MSDLKLPKLKVSSNGMHKVDALGWAAGFALKSYGVRVGIRTNDPALLERARQHLPADWTNASSTIVDRVYSILAGGKGSRSSTRRLNVLYGDHERLSRSFDLDELFDTLESDLRLFVAEWAKHRVFVHAGVVGWKGQAIVIPGRSYSGKSTMVAELVRAGATYYSDEYAVFDARGRVHPFSKPIELREEGKFVQTKVHVADLGGREGTKPLPVGLVLMTRFESGARWRPRKLTPGQGVLEMLFNTVSARRSPERALATLRVVASHASVLKGVRGDATEVISRLLKKLEEQ
jgi:hypothetical protein